MTEKTLQDQIDRINAISAYAGGNRFDEDENRLTRDPKTRRITSSPDYGSDEQVSVAFTSEEVFSKAASFDAGVPTYVPMDFITLTTPGNKLNMVHRPVTDMDMWRFPLEWEGFKSGQQAVESGTPLEAWPLLTKGQIKDLKHNNVHTVEQVANLSDSVQGVLRAFYSMKLKAAAFLESRADKSAEVELQAKLDERDARLAALEAQLAALLAAQANTSEPKPKRA
jgi:hypothetical protein